MQKLQAKLKNTPRNASLVPCSVSSGLNKEETLSDQNKVLTKSKRIENKIEKSHINDAFVIANGTKQTRNGNYVIEQKRKNNRALQLNIKGFKPSVRRRRYSCQPKDLVKINKKLYEVVGTHSYGKSVVIKNSKEKLDVSIRKINWKYHFGSIIFKGRQFIPSLKEGVSLPK